MRLAKNGYQERMHDARCEPMDRWEGTEKSQVDETTFSSVIF